jgi:CheY-like chemotaxis protein
MTEPTHPILVIEDHDDTRQMMATLIGHYGFDVATAGNGRQGLEQLQQLRPRLVLLDLMMPVMTGWEFREAQLSLQDRQLAAVPVVLLTAAPGADQIAKQLGINDIIRKPIDIDHVVTIVHKHCRA